MDFDRSCSLFTKMCSTHGICDINWQRRTVKYSEARALIQYKDAVLPVKEIPLCRYDGRKIVLSPQWDFLYW